MFSVFLDAQRVVKLLMCQYLQDPTDRKQLLRDRSVVFVCKCMFDSNIYVGRSVQWHIQADERQQTIMVGWSYMLSNHKPFFFKAMQH